MSTHAVKKQVVVEVSQAHAFHVFTTAIDTWWPREHRIGKGTLKAFHLEPHVGGRWYEENTEGARCDTGKVLVWDPPVRLVLAWQITADWQHDPGFVTEVEVRFIPTGPQQTRVELEHRDLERYGDKREALTKAIDSEGGWSGILAKYAEVAARFVG